MSTWKTLLAFLGGAVTGPVAGKVVDAVIALLNNPQTGGLAGLVKTLREKGLDDVVSSWISTGANRAASAEQVRQALGEGRIQQVAQSAGVTNQKASQGLAALLPQIIDMLTPDGKLPEGAAARGGATQGGGTQTEGLAQALAAIRNKLMA